jgi:hypothetical protein
MVFILIIENYIGEEKMKKIVTLSLIAAMSLSNVYALSNAELADKLSSVEAELAKIKAKVKKQNKKINKIKSHDSNDNIKWGVDLRTSLDSINYDMADGSSKSKSDLMSMRLWLNMAYAPDSHNIFKGQLSMNKAFGADFIGDRTYSMGGQFDWVTNEALTDSSLKVRQAYWLYLGDSLLGANIPWTFSVGRRPSTGGFLGNLRNDDDAQSPLAHVIDVEFDGLSSKLDLSNIMGISGMSFKVCMGQGSTNAEPLLTATQYANDDTQLDDIKLAGFIFVPYNDGQFIVKTNWYKAFDLPGMDMNQDGSPTEFRQYGDIQGAAVSVMVDGLTDEGFFADTKLFGSYAWSETNPYEGSSMLGSADDESGTSYLLGAQWKCLLSDKGTVGIEFNHGSKYWRPFTYAEDTMVGSKIAARGDAFEAYFTYQLTDAISAQVRYTKVDYDYTGSNGFFGNYSGTPIKISDIKAGAAAVEEMGGVEGVMNAVQAGYLTQAQADGMLMASSMAAQVVETAEDFRFYLRYRF